MNNEEKVKMNQNYPTDGAILTAQDGKPVFSAGASKNPAYTIDPTNAAYGLGPVTAKKAYGIRNNRAIKLAAEKELNQDLSWA
jgi:hypothetical protein